MRILPIILVFVSLPTSASIMGISTHPLRDEARAFSAEMTGFMSERHEMGMGARYTHEVSPYKRLDVTASGAQDSRAFTLGAGMDLELLSEDVNQPRISFKPFWRQEKFEHLTTNTIGAAPSVRKGFSLQGNEFFPYLAIPAGMKIDSATSEFVFYSSLTFGASMPFPGAQNERLLLSVEGNKDMGASSDYLGCLVSWIWN